MAGPGAGISLPMVHLSEKPALRLLSGDGGGHDRPELLMSAWPGEDAGRSRGSRVSPGRGGSGPGSLASAGGSEPGCAEARRPRVLSSLPLERGWPAFLGKRLFSHMDQTDVSRVAGSPSGVTWWGHLSCRGSRGVPPAAGGRSRTFLLLGREQ